MDTILQINNLSVKFDTGIQRVNAIDNMSLHVYSGEILGIIGASGSGKSTIGKTILGLEAKSQFTSGELLYIQGDESIDLLGQSKEEWQRFRKNHSTIVFQNPLLNLNPTCTIKTHFERVLSLHDKKNKPSIISDVLRKAELNDNQSAILEAFPHQLSGGQQQRVLIALALCQGVEVLILDEPMSSLDSRSQDSIARVLRQLVEEDNLTIVLISHDLNIIGRLSDRICVMNNGQLVEEGTAADILDNPKNEYTQRLVQAKELGLNTSTDNEQDPIITIERLSHEFKKGGFLAWKKSKVEALKQINLVVNKGSITGLVGASGSGKTTLVRLVLGIIDIQTGAITYNGKPISDLTNHQLRTKIQLISQNANDAFNPRMLIDNQLKEVYRAHYSDADNYEQVISSLIKDVDLAEELRYRYPSELSGGEIQRMAIVRALIVKPEVLILDESLSALDMIVQHKIINLIVQLNSKLNMTIIMISHDDRVIRKCCTSIRTLDRGALV